MATLTDERARAEDTQRDPARLQLPVEERETAAGPPAHERHVQRLASGEGCGCARCTGDQHEELSPVARHVLDLQQRLGNSAVVQLLADPTVAPLLRGVQRSPITDAFGTRDVPGFREGPDARAEGEALARRAGAPAGGAESPSTLDTAEGEEEPAQLAVERVEESEEEVQLGAAPETAARAIEEEAEEAQLSNDEEDEEAAQLSNDEEDEEAAQLSNDEEDEEAAQLSTIAAPTAPSVALPDAELQDGETGAAGAGQASGGVPDTAVSGATVTPPPGGGSGGPRARPATPARIDVPALRERITLTPIQRLAEDSLDVDTAELDDVDTSSLDDTPDGGEPDLSAVDSAGDSLESARPSGGGGIVDAAIDTALSYLSSAFSSAVSMVRGGAGEARSQTREGAAEAETTASEAVISAKGEVTDAASETAAEAQSEASASAEEVRSGVGATRSALRGMMRSLGGSIRPRIQAWLQSAGSDEEFVESVVGPIRAQLQRHIARLQSLIETIRVRLTGLVDRAAARLTSVAASIAETLTSALDAVQRIVERVIERVRQAIQGVIDRAVAVIRNVPAIVMELISGLVHRAVAAARRVVDLVVNAARRVIDMIFRGIQAVIELVQRAIAAIIEALRRALTAIIDRILTAISSLIDRVVAAIHRAAAVIAEKVRAIVGSVMRAILRVAQVAIEEFLRPQLEAARAKAREAYEEFQRILPMLREYAEQAKRQMRESLDEGIDQMVDTGADVIDSLLNPDGDHFAIGGQINAEVFAGVVAGAGVGAHVSGSYAYDFVADYAHNQIGIFFTIAFAAGGNIGVGASAEVDVGVSVGWGTQYNLASKKDVADAAGGYNATFGVGVGATAELEGGVAVATGHSFSMSLDTVGDLICPKEEDQPSPTPTPTPTPTPEHTPEPTPEPEPEFDHYPLDGWIVFFPTGGATLDGEDLAVVERAANVIPAEVGRHDDAAAIVSVDGHSSPRWRAPRPDETAASENQALSGRRATAVFEALRARMPNVPGPLTMTSAGHGDEAARTDGADPDSDDQRYRIATISGEVVATRPGTGSLTTTGGGAGTAAGAGDVMRRSSVADRYGCAVANQLPAVPFLGSESADEYLRSRPYGWDTTMYAGVAGGAGISASYSADIGLSRAFELWSSPKLDDRVMQAIRLMIGMLKLGMDVSTMSPVSFVRDAISIAPAVGDTAVDMLLFPITMIEITLDIADG